MRHLDLFSGIGGFALAARWSGFETVAFCEIDQYCQKVLGKHWPQVPIYADIKTLTRQGLESDGIYQPDIITGGFPCQPFSVAGKQRGQDDDRHLWPEMLRIISELHPTWVIGENVPGIIKMGLDNILADLEGQGYTSETFVLGASSVNAPHRRARVFVLSCLSDPNRHRRQMPDRKLSANGGDGTPVLKERRAPVKKQNPLFYDPNRFGFKGSAQKSLPRLPDLPTKFIGTGTDPHRGWATEPGICRTSHGVPHRVDRLKGLGNAVVPQLVHNLFEIIKQVDKEKRQ
jgi:DNA (cytosine-5)-methyltransferase 1